MEILKMLKLKNIRIKFGRNIILETIDADFTPGGAWVIAGVNGSGKSILGKVITGLLEPDKGEIHSSVNTAYSSFELQDKIMESEIKKDASRLMHGATDKGTSVEDWLSLKHYEDKTYADKLISMFSLFGVLEKGLRVLSTGEFRKTILLSALLKKPDLLVIDDPFDGLDFNSRENLKIVINKLAGNNQKIILITNKIEDIFPECTHMLLLADGRVKFSGNLKGGVRLFKKEQELETKYDHLIELPVFPDKRKLLSDSKKDLLIKMKDVSVVYDGVKVLNNINWKVHRGDSWKITGVNGSGKSTLLNLVNGDNTQAYSNNISLFGRQRGTGESVWDIKRRIGFVSGDFQMQYRVRTTVLDVIISGLYDSIGLYTQSTNLDIEKGYQWLKFIGLPEKKNTLFRELSYGEMRMTLIARAMIKSPDMLILDEPCQGLDIYNKNKILDLSEKIGSDPNSTILFVTHDQTINLTCFSHSLELKKNDI